MDDLEATMWCRICDAPCCKTYKYDSQYCDQCKERHAELANTIWCSSCYCPCSKNSDSDVSTCMACSKEDLANIFDISSTESASSAEIKELHRRIAEQDLRLSFLRLQLDNKHANGSTLKGDVVIVVQGRLDEQLYAHKLILSSKSPVFSKMFEIKSLEEGRRMIQIHDTSLPVMRAVINFCYNAEIDFTHEVTSEEVIKVAHKYDIDFLQKICEEHLIRTLNSLNLPRRLRLAMKLEAKELWAVTRLYFKKHFDKVVWDVLEEFC